MRPRAASPHPSCGLCRPDGLTSPVAATTTASHWCHFTPRIKTWVGCTLSAAPNGAGMDAEVVSGWAGRSLLRGKPCRRGFFLAQTVKPRCQSMRLFPFKVGGRGNKPPSFKAELSAAHAAAQRPDSPDLPAKATLTHHSHSQTSLCN